MQDRHKMFAFFGYEHDRGRNSNFWRNPAYFDTIYGKERSGLGGYFEEWKARKRAITFEEATSGRWIKRGDHGYSFEVELLPDYTLKERALTGGEWWGGTWELIGIALRMRVGIYELDILADKTNNTFSGIETANGSLNAYFNLSHENFERVASSGDEFTIEIFAEKLLQEKELSTVEPEVREQIKSDLVRRIEDYVNFFLIEYLDPNQLTEFNNLLSTNSDTALLYLKENIDDYQNKIAQLLINFRERYLGIKKTSYES